MLAWKAALGPLENKLAEGYDCKGFVLVLAYSLNIDTNNAPYLNKRAKCYQNDYNNLTAYQVSLQVIFCYLDYTWCRLVIWLDLFKLNIYFSRVKESCGM